MKEWTDDDQKQLRAACDVLEASSFIADVSRAVGKPLAQSVQRWLPASANATLHRFSQKALAYALVTAFTTLPSTQDSQPNHRLHQVGIGISGAVGGWFGIGGLVVDLPVSTLLLLRSIGDVARHHGEDVHTLHTQLACLEIFALSGARERILIDTDRATDNALYSAYYAVRLALAPALQYTIQYAAQQSTHWLTDVSTPIIAQLITQIAARFSLVVSQKGLVQTLPFLGAISGATINVLFMQHFQTLAEGHFTIRRLERRYGAPAVEAAYRTLITGAIPNMQNEYEYE